ncbi:MAG TPA: fimbria/pilus outer membrane usher protein [bacterium]|nr:fimbria/pilus outer membrane usher protein [bacterium]
MEAKYLLSLGLVCCVLLAGPPAYTQHMDEAPLEVHVNTENRGAHVVELNSSGDVLIPTNTAHELGLRHLPAPVQIEGQPYVSLRSLGPSVTYKVDLQTLTLGITADPAMLASQTVDLAQRPPANVIHTEDNSFYLNYAFNYTRNTPPSPDILQVPWEMALRLGSTLAYSSFLYSRTENPATPGGQGSADENSVRLFTNLTWDNPDVQRRVVLGDTVAQSGQLGGGSNFAGLSISKNFQLAPYFIQHPPLDVKGLIQTPSDVDVYVGDILVKTIKLSPGPFELTNVPLAQGAGEVTLVIKDAFGRESRVSLPFYVSNTLLKPGLQSYSYNLGYERELFGTESNKYGKPIFSAFHDVGITDWLTLGLRAEGREHLANYGGRTAFLLWRLGQIDAGYAHSKEGDAEGNGRFLAYQYASRHFGFSLSEQSMSGEYANLSIDAIDNKTSSRRTATVGIPIKYLGTIAGSYVKNDLYEGDDIVVRSLYYSRKVTNRISLLARATDIADLNPAGDQHQKEWFVGLRIDLGGGLSSQVANQDKDGLQTRSISLDQNPPLGPGLGYHILASRQPGQEEDHGYDGEFSMQYNANHAMYSAQYRRTDGQPTTTLGLSGSVAEVGGSWHLGRPIADSFALVRLNGMDNVRIYSSNNQVGRTDENGEILVPNLTSYFGNMIGLEEQDVPVDYRIPELRQFIAPPYRSGAVVNFDVTRIQGIVGHIYFLEKGVRTPADYAGIEVMVDGKAKKSIVAKKGEFYLENLPPGTHSARLYTNKKECRFDMKIPKSDEMLVDLGEIDCEVH